MTVLERLIRDLEASKGNLHAQAVISAEFFLSALPEQNRLLLHAAIDAGAILRWFDADLLAQVLDISSDEAGKRFQEMNKLPFVERFPNQERELKFINQPTRLGWRKKLFREQSERFHKLSSRAAGCFVGYHSSKGCIEWIYHLLYADPMRGVMELKRLEQKWTSSDSTTEERYVLAAVLKEFNENKSTFSIEQSAAAITDIKLSHWSEKLKQKRELGRFDVFLCHNSEDKPAVQELAERLKKSAVLPWLDIWELRPGKSWLQLLEEQIGNIDSAAVCVGPKGFGPWQKVEIYNFLCEVVNRKILVIPVMLPNALEQPKLPLFLQGFGWVDFRKSDPDPMKHLLWGITGVRPEDQ